MKHVEHIGVLEEGEESTMGQKLKNLFALIGHTI